MSRATDGISRNFHFNSEGMREAEQAFRQTYPAFASTSALDDLRAREYARLDDAGHIYFDYTGGGLYAESRLREHFELLRGSVFGNPHSLNPTSRAMTELVERARASVLDFFQASPDEYAVVFTSNASQALKLVGEAYPFQPGGQFLLLFDNHNSVNGMREFARAKGAAFTYLPVMAPDLRVEEALLLSFLEQGRDSAHPLFAYPAQSNFTGVQHPLEWIETAQARGWQVLLDAAAFVPTNRLDLSRWHPDFVPLSFYKLFGYPTGVGCLLARKAALATLRRPWFAGGTVWGISVQGDGYVLLSGGEGFEDGTLNYLTLPAVEIGLKHLQAIGMETIHERVRCLTGWLLGTLLSLRHRNGRPLVEVYGPHTTERRGGTVALNFFDPNGSLIDERVVDRGPASFVSPCAPAAFVILAPVKQPSICRKRHCGGSSMRSPGTRCRSSSWEKGDELGSVPRRFRDAERRRCARLARSGHELRRCVPAGAVRSDLPGYLPRRKRVATPASLLRTQRHEFNRSDEQKILLS
jgi:molybdenum cofactor sulfurtransferase